MLASCSAGSDTPLTTLATTIPRESPFFDGQIAEVLVAGETLTVAVADTSAERAQGLMGVDDLAGLDGMLFVHDDVANVSYTMRDTLIPLDIWFIGPDGAIVGADEMTPCATAACPSYRSPGPVALVLETELGRFDFPIGSVVSVVE